MYIYKAFLARRVYDGFTIPEIWELVSSILYSFVLLLIGRCIYTLPPTPCVDKLCQCVMTLYMFQRCMAFLTQFWVYWYITGLHSIIEFYVVRMTFEWISIENAIMYSNIEMSGMYCFRECDLYFGMEIDAVAVCIVLNRVVVANEEPIQGTYRSFLHLKNAYKELLYKD